MSHLQRRCALLCLVVAAGCDGADSATAPPRGLTSHPVVAGATVTVTTTADAGPGSLRDAIANATGGETIDFAPSLAGQRIDLTTGPLVIEHPMLITGPAPAGVIVHGGGRDEVLLVNSLTGEVTLRNLTITGGYSLEYGGGILNYGNLTLDHTLVTGNEVYGTAKVRGGGIYSGGSLTLVNSTVSGNRSGRAGGGIWYDGGGTFRILNSTIVDNTAGVQGGGIIGNDVLLRNSIVANNTAPSGANCDTFGTPPIYSGTNLSNDATCGTNAALLVADPLLGPLASNGGPTRTHALLLGSPAIDAATDCNVVDDQRYVPRPQPAGSACDIGAFEFNAFATIALTVDASGSGILNTSAAVVSGSATCSASGQVGLEVTLTQPQKVGRVNTSVVATDVVAVNCVGKVFWSVALKPASGGFQNGTGTVTVTTKPTPSGFLATTATAPVKIFWGKK